MLCLALVVCAAGPATEKRNKADGVKAAELKEWNRTTGLEAAREWYSARLKDAKRRQAEVKKARIDRRVTKPEGETTKAAGRDSLAFRNDAEKKAALAKAEAEVDRFEAILENPPPLPPLLQADKFEIGLVGAPRSPRALWHESADSFEVLQVVSESLLLVVMRDYPSGTDVNFLLEGGTTGFVDGKTYGFGDSIYEVMGTRTYTSVLGANKTVFVLRPLKVVDKK